MLPRFYSPFVVYKDLVFVSGQVGLDPATRKLANGGFDVEVKQALENLKNRLQEAGSSMEKVLKVTVFVKDMKLYDRFNEIYRTYFAANPPARSLVEVSNLPLGAQVEVEAIAHLS